MDEEISLVVMSPTVEMTLTYNKQSLMASSPYFAAMFSPHFLESTQRKVYIQCEFPPCLQTILDLTTKNKEIDWKLNNPLELFHTSIMFQFEEVYTCIKKYLFESWLTVDTCLITMFSGPHLGIDEDVIKYATVVCQREMERIVSTQAFLDLSLAQVQFYLNMDNLIIYDEFNVIRSIFRWIESDFKTRSKHTMLLLETVHYSSLSDKELNMSTKFMCVQASKEAKMLINMIQSMKVKEVNHHINDKEERLAKILLQKPSRKFGIKFQVLCQYFTVSSYISTSLSSRYCDEKEVLLEYNSTENTLIEKEVKVTKLFDLKPKIFKNASLGSIIHINSGIFAVYDHHNKLELYQLDSTKFAVEDGDSNTSRTVHLDGTLVLRDSLNDRRKYEIIDIKNKTTMSIPKIIDFQPKRLKCCVYKGDIYIFGKSCSYSHGFDYTVQILHAPDYYQESTKDGMKPLQNPTLEKREINISRVTALDLNVGDNIQLVISAYNGIYIVTEKMSLHKLILGEFNEYIERIEYKGSFQDQNKQSSVWGFAHCDMIYVWIHCKNKLSLNTYDIERNKFGIKLEKKNHEINARGFNVLGAFSVPL